jgi:hypothetical protein
MSSSAAWKRRFACFSVADRSARRMLSASVGT